MVMHNVWVLTRAVLSLTALRTPAAAAVDVLGSLGYTHAEFA